MTPKPSHYKCLNCKAIISVVGEFRPSQVTLDGKPYPCVNCGKSKFIPIYEELPEDE